MLRTVALLLLFSLSASPAVAASPVKARVLSGIGIILFRSDAAKQQPALILFKEPSLGRIAALDIALIPALSQSITPPEGFTPAIVTSKKSGWYRIVYDDGEREAWIEGRSSYQFYRWEELLKNRQVAMLGGLKKDFYLLRSGPDLSAASIAAVDKGSRVNSLFTDGDWIRVLTDSHTDGWLRWRDENSRLVISVNL